MQYESQDNAQVTAMVQRAVESYEYFTTALRGSAADIMAGLSAGTKSFLSIKSSLDAIKDRFLDNVADIVSQDLAYTSVIARERASTVPEVSVDDRAVAVSESLTAGFSTQLMSVFEKQAAADVRKTDTFVRNQLVQGRFFATTEQLSTDLTFSHLDKADRQIKSEVHVFREVNWAYRQLFNTSLVYALVSSGIEEGVASGGSKNGTVIKLDNFDAIQPSIFHHNSKSLLQPNYSVS